jgi:anti-sigma regulatory factor (Ser/Thr protein kinase)
MSEKYSLNFTLPFDLKCLSLLEENIKKFFNLLNFDTKKEEFLIFKINLALTEAIVNAIKHSEDVKEDNKIRISMKYDGKNIIVNVHSRGKPFNVHSIKRPDPLSISGRGLYVISRLMDELDLQNIDGENILIMKKNI